MKLKYPDFISTISAEMDLKGTAEHLCFLENLKEITIAFLC